MSLEKLTGRRVVVVEDGNGAELSVTVRMVPVGRVAEYTANLNRGRLLVQICTGLSDGQIDELPLHSFNALKAAVDELNTGPLLESLRLEMDRLERFQPGITARMEKEQAERVQAALSKIGSPESPSEPAGASTPASS